MGSNNDKIAVIGMAGKFPGAGNISEFWENLMAGKEGITRFEDEELAPYEYNFDELRDNPDYVKARGILTDVDKFDAGFFGYSPGEAAHMDPQQRIWLETAWHAFEDAGCDPFSYRGNIAVFAGSYTNTYLLNNILRNPDLLEKYIRLRSTEAFQVMTSNESAYLSSRTAYKFNLKGPAINVQTACSTSLVAISQACQSLFGFESDVCIAGGVCVVNPQQTGYLYQEGAIPSPDGHCRPFDANAKGTVFSNGIGIVVLKRLEDALRDNDRIYAVVSGWALNNDGSNKVSYTAPGVEGQAEVISMAQDFAGINPADISYIEAHGTATPLGDPVEVSALTKAFRRKTDKKGYCGIGSVKSNIGHTDAAAGVASFIKACLSAYYGKIPPSINFSQANPHIPLKDSPFYIQDKPGERKGDKPLIIGVSSFGIGGTNAHVILEQPPLPEKRKDKKPAGEKFILLSARSEKSLENQEKLLISFLREHPETSLDNLAYTLDKGRALLPYRSFCLASSVGDIAGKENKFISGKAGPSGVAMAFMFPGQGAQYPGMGKDLYHSLPFVREIMDRCFEIYQSETGRDIKKIMFGDSAKALSSTEITQPALFIHEYALARLFMHYGIRPGMLIGHSIGEYVAACIAGVFDLNSALKIVIKRGELMAGIPGGDMLAVKAPAEDLVRISEGKFEIAAENAPKMCSISFSSSSRKEVLNLLDENNLQYIPLTTSHAFHSSAFDPVLEDFAAFVNKFQPGQPDIPVVSCLSGEFLANEQARSGEYWARQLRETVMFRKGISQIASRGDTLFLETGPDTHLRSLVLQNEDVKDKSLVISTLGKPGNRKEHQKVAESLGKLWLKGAASIPEHFRSYTHAVKISLPLYPFERISHWIDFRLSGFAPAEKTAVAIDGEQLVTQEAENMKAPNHTTENKLREIWGSLLGYADPGTEDDFFEQGGHSLLALQVLTRIKENFRVNISLKMFAENPTISKLAQVINHQLGMPEEKEEFIHLSGSGHLPLSANQKRLWILSKLEKNSPSYNIPFTYHLKGKPDTALFRKTLTYIFNRQHVMYSVFRYRNNQAFCEIKPHQPKLELPDYSPYPAGDRQEKIFAFIAKDSRKTFNLEKGPLYRFYIIKENEKSYYIHATIHHLIFDGWSWGVFVNEFNHVYNSLLRGKDPQLKEIEFHHYDYAEWQRKSISEKDDPALVAYWKNKLKGCSQSTAFPWDHKRPEEPSGFGEKEYLQIPPGYVDSLREISRREGTTMYVTMLSSIALLLSKYAGEEDFCIGTPVANRPRIQLEEIFGMFVNTIALRMKVQPGMSFSDLIRYTREEFLESISHQELPFEKVVESLEPQRIPGMNPLFQIAFAWLNNLGIPMILDDNRAERITVDKGVAPFDITFYLWENEDYIEGEIEYNADILDRSTAIQLKKDLIRLIEIITSEPGLAVSEIRGFPGPREGKESKVMEGLIPGGEQIINTAEHTGTRPLSETMKRLVPVWESILKTKLTDYSASFFESGGNSLLAISLINKVEEAFDTEISFRQLVNNPDIISFGNLLDETTKKPAPIKLHHSKKTKGLPLSVNQKRMWLINKMNPDVPSYIIPFTYHIKGELNERIFRKSLEKLVERHPVLFSRIREENEQPVCDIVYSELNYHELDFTGLPAHERSKRLEQFVDEESQKAFNLAEDDLYRLFLIRMSEGEFYFHLTIHHLIFDGWSWQIFNNELSGIYNNLLEGQALNLGKPEFHQYDYAQWEKENPDALIHDESVKYWRTILEDAPPVLNFPFDFPRKKHPTGLGGRELVRIPAGISNGLRELARKTGSSLFSVMFSTFSLLIHKYSGDEDICIGTPVANRPVSDLENIMGMFVNTLVLRSDFSRNLSFRELVEETHSRAMESFAHKDLPFEKMVEIVKPERSFNINPLFQVSFAWQNNLNVPLRFRNLETERYVGRKGSTPFDLSFYMWENGDHIEGELEFSGDLLKRESVLKLRERYLRLLKRLVENFDASIHNIPIISDEEKEMIFRFNDTATDYPKDKSIVSLFREQTGLFPEKVAVSFESNTLTYRELDHVTDKLAATLIKKGVKREMPVGLMMERSMEMIIAVLAILKAGGAYLPVDPEYPVNRINFILRDAGCNLLLCRDKTDAALSEEVEVLNIAEKQAYEKDPLPPEQKTGPQDLAYIMYTSGTTGTPKGSLIQHNSVIRLVRNNHFIDPGPGDRFLMTGAIVFDATTFEIWGALLNGGSLYIVDKETLLKPRSFGKALKENRITILWLTSALLTQMVEIRTDIFSGLRCLLAGGDVLSPVHINKLRKDIPHLKVINGYGPTENTTFSTTFLIDRDYEYNIPIGKPISNSTAYVFDKHMNLQPPGIIGELHLGGDGLSRGYLNRDDLNSSSFVENPYDPRERLYKSGDRARLLPDGNIEFHGRIDNQLKIRGFRVELEEIENVLSSLKGVLEAVVKPYKVADGDIRLVAFLNANKNFEKDLRQISAAIKEKLPPYMIPAAYKILHGFPKTINGKTDKKALHFDPSRFIAGTETGNGDMNRIEKEIHDIWKRILKKEDFSIHDNFFDIGGNSLLAISVLSRMESQFNIEMNLRLFFDSPKIKDLAESVEITQIKQARPGPGKEEDSPIVKGEI